MKRFLVLATCALLSLPAFAQSVREKKAWDEAKSKAKATSAEIKTACGVDVTVGFNEKSYKNIEDVEKYTAWCANDIRTGITQLCGDADYKTAFSKKVKKITCAFDPTLKSGSDHNYGNKLSMSGSEVTQAYNKDSSNLEQKLVDFLKQQL